MKKKKEKRKISKELLKLLLLSLLLLVFGIVIFKNLEYRIALSIVVATIPYGYLLMGFIEKEKFLKLGKFGLVLFFLIKLFLGTFIGIGASVVVIGQYLLEDIQK